jgi:hypothetical protein
VRDPQFTLFGPGFPEGLEIPSVGVTSSPDTDEAVAGSSLLGMFNLSGLLPAELIALLTDGGDLFLVLEEDPSEVEADPSAEDPNWLRFLMGLPEALHGESIVPPPLAVDQLVLVWLALPEVAKPSLAEGKNPLNESELHVPLHAGISISGVVDLKTTPAEQERVADEAAAPQLSAGHCLSSAVNWWSTVVLTAALLCGVPGWWRDGQRDRSSILEKRCRVDRR